MKFFRINLLIISYSLFFTSCNKTILNYRINGKVTNTDHFKYAYLFIEEKGNEKKKYPVENEPFIHFYESPIVNNTFYFRGKTIKDIYCPFTFGYIVLDSVQNINTERAKMKSRSDGKEIVLNDETIRIDIINNLRVNEANIYAGKYTELYNKARTIIIRKSNYEKDLQSYMKFIQDNPNSLASLFLIQIYSGLYTIIPTDSVKKSSQYLSPKLQKSPVFEDIQQKLVWAKEQELNDTNKKPSLRFK